MANEPTIEIMNITIARFMGMEGSDKFISQNYGYDKGWQWLMPVVEKIHTLKKHNPDGKDLCLMSQLTINMDMDGYYNRCRCSILGHITHCYTLSIPHNYETVDLPSIFVHDKNTLIEAVYDAVYQFITWYNQQPQTNGQNNGTNKG